jgi:flagellar hook-length control protein FliK
MPSSDLSQLFRDELLQIARFDSLPFESAPPDPRLDLKNRFSDYGAVPSNNTTENEDDDDDDAKESADESNQDASSTAPATASVTTYPSFENSRTVDFKNGRSIESENTQPPEKTAANDAESTSLTEPTLSKALDSINKQDESIVSPSQELDLSKAGNSESGIAKQSFDGSVPESNPTDESIDGSIDARRPRTEPSSSGRSGERQAKDVVSQGAETLVPSNGGLAKQGSANDKLKEADSKEIESSMAEDIGVKPIETNDGSRADRLEARKQRQESSRDRSSPYIDLAVPADVENPLLKEPVPSALSPSEPIFSDQFNAPVELASDGILEPITASGTSNATLPESRTATTTGVNATAQGSSSQDPSSSNSSLSGSSISNNSTSIDARNSTRDVVRQSTGPLSRYQESKLVQRVLRGMEQLSQGGGQVRLRLHPPELGTLQMTLRIESNQVSAQLDVENSVARDALLKNMQSLHDRLRDQGLQVERFEVHVRPDVGSDASFSQNNRDQSDSDSRWRTMESRYAATNDNTLPARSSDPDFNRSRVAWTRTQGSLDLTV